MSSTIFVIFLCPIRLDMWERLVLIFACERSPWRWANGAEKLRSIVLSHSDREDLRRFWRSVGNTIFCQSKICRLVNKVAWQGYLALNPKFAAWSFTWPGMNILLYLTPWFDLPNWPGKGVTFSPHGLKSIVSRRKAVASATVPQNTGA